jgi:hypothetical protein
MIHKISHFEKCILQQRIFHHGLNTILPKDNNPLDRAAVIADSVEDILYT